MGSLSEFLAMGGYAVFVWPAYIISAIVLAGTLGFSLRGLAKAEAEADRLSARMPARTSADQPGLEGAAAGGKQV
jgi:heme exporter protein D